MDNILPNIGNEESNPTVINDKVYVGSSNHKVYCLDANTGLKLWTFLTNDFVYSSPAVAYGKVYIGSNNCKLYCLDADTGEKSGL